MKICPVCKKVPLIRKETKNIDRTTICPYCGRGEEKKMICPKCNKEYTGDSATSRIDQTPICPMCGHREALEAAVKAGVMSNEEAENILVALEKNY